jgi:hypothetical protein
MPIPPTIPAVPETMPLVPCPSAHCYGSDGNVQQTMEFIWTGEGVNADEKLVGVESQPTSRLSSAEAVDGIHNVQNGKPVGSEFVAVNFNL